MSTPVEIHGFKVFGNDVNKGMAYLKKLRKEEAREMFLDAKNSSDKDFHFKAYIPGDGERHYVIIYRGSDGYELRYKP